MELAPVRLVTPSAAADRASPIVRLAGVVRTYREGGLSTPVLKGVSLTLSRGRLHMVLGASGSGKTTLLNLLGGIDRADAGDVVVDGLNLTTAPNRDVVRFRREQLGFIFQFYNLMPTLTARENVELALEHQPLAASARRARADEVLAAVGLQDFRDRFPGQLSGGEQQRVAVARALVRRPALLLCDEPTGNLDSESGQHVVMLIDTLRRESGTTAIVVTHNPALFSAPDRVLHIKDGVIDEACGHA
ncbi:MAG: ABC transporter ATP-binding protein [Deltaproteobacteria bacterium]|nr:ABC transporter ATP-binding protein [Deltaproteobacteria bacterium]